MITNRYIIKAEDFTPIKDVLNSRAYLSASFASSSCNWNGHIYCDVTIPNDDYQISTHKWMSVTGSKCHFISII